MTLDKRLSELERKANPKKDLPTMKIATIDTDGSATIDINNERFTFPNEKALDDWVDENKLNESGLPMLKIEIVNSPQNKTDTD